MFKQKHKELKRNTCLAEFLATKEYAKEHKIDFNLSFDEFAELANVPCTYCGGRTPGYESNTLSYIDWKTGYTPGNVRASCWPCKRVVGYGRSVAGNLDHIHKICEHLQTHDLNI